MALRGVGSDALGAPVGAGSSSNPANPPHRALQFVGQQAYQQPRRAAPAVSSSERKRQGMAGVRSAAVQGRSWPHHARVVPICCPSAQAAPLPPGKLRLLPPAALPHEPQGVKATLRKLFSSRRSGHQRLPDEDMMDAEEHRHPMSGQQSSFSFGR